MTEPKSSHYELCSDSTARNPRLKHQPNLITTDIEALLVRVGRNDAGQIDPHSLWREIARALNAWHPHVDSDGVLKIDTAISEWVTRVRKPNIKYFSHILTAYQITVAAKQQGSTWLLRREQLASWLGIDRERLWADDETFGQPATLPISPVLEQARAFHLAIQALPVGKYIRNRLTLSLDAHIAALSNLADTNAGKRS